MLSKWIFSQVNEYLIKSSHLCRRSFDFNAGTGDFVLYRNLDRYFEVRFYETRSIIKKTCKRVNYQGRTRELLEYLKMCLFVIVHSTFGSNFTEFRQFYIPR